MDMLAPRDPEDWRFGRVPYLPYDLPCRHPEPPGAEWIDA
jgi:hypothetical protein